MAERILLRNREVCGPHDVRTSEERILDGDKPLPEPEVVLEAPETETETETEKLPAQSEIEDTQSGGTFQLDPLPTEDM